MRVKRSIASALLLAAACAAASAWAQDEDSDRIRIHGGYIAGVEYLDMDGLQKKAYVKGLVEGMLLAPAFGAPEESMLWLYDCTNEMDIDEVRKLLFDYIKDRHDLWENRNPAKSFRAISQACLALLQAGAGDTAGDGEEEVVEEAEEAGEEVEAAE
jgi:hypothetical protein